MNPSSPYSVAILAYPGMTMLDAIGPNEVLANSPHFDVQFVSATRADVHNDHGSLKLTGLTHYSDIPMPDILLIPGGPGDHALMQDEVLLSWIAKVDEQARIVASVCTGALILAKAGLLNGRQACTHWACLQELAELGANPMRKRFRRDGKYWTASGVSAGIDMALAMVEALQGLQHAKQLRFGIEYFPNQFHLISSYSLPRGMLSALSDKVMGVIGAARKKFVEQHRLKHTHPRADTSP